MLNSVFFIMIFLHNIFVPFQTLTPVDNDSEVKFTIKNFGLNVHGSFHGLKGAIIFDPFNLPKSKMDVSINASTINTNNASRDNHLKRDDYFDIIHFPKISFRSTEITRGETKDSFEALGFLQIKESKKMIRIPFTSKSLGRGYLFSGSFSINRTDFGIGGASISLSENLTVSLKIVTK